jgi:hypothetical protein
MNKNEEKDLEIRVRWEEEKEIKTVEELNKFLIEKSLDSIKNRKALILYKGYEIEYDFDNGEFSCEYFGNFKTYYLYEITDKIDEEIEKKNNKSKIIQSKDREI